MVARDRALGIDPRGSSDMLRSLGSLFRSWEANPRQRDKFAALEQILQVPLYLHGRVVRGVRSKLEERTVRFMAPS